MAIRMTPSGPQSYLPEEQQGIFTPKKTPEQKCKDRGGKWDGTRCVMPTSNKEDVEEQQAEKDLQIMRESSGFQIGNRKVTKEEYYRIKSQIPGTEGGSRGGIVTEEDKAIAASLDVTPEQRALEAERQALLANEPVKRELDPVTNELEVIPVVGALLNNIQRGIKSKIPWLARNDDPIYTNVTPEELRTAALTEIERIEIEKGLTDSEKFGRFAESINLGELEKYIPGLGDAELPSGNVQTRVNALRMLKTRGRDIISNAESGDLTRSQAEERIDLIEKELQEGESRIKMLIQESPELKFNSDGVNFIEGKILEVRIILQDARFAALNAPIKPSQMTDLKIYQTLDSYDDEDYDIPGLE